MAAQLQDSRQTLQQHPLSAVFPAMPEADLEALAGDIKKHGLREPGVLFEDMVLDGWHRYLACERVGVEFRYFPFDGEDPRDFVISHNLHRRHLTASQRAAAVVAAHNWRPHGDQKSRSAPGADRTSAEMALEAEVSERTIRQAKAAHEAGLGDKVKSGEVSAKRAAQVAKLQKAKREKALKDPKPPKPKKADVTDAEVAKLRKAVEELTEQKNDLADTARELQDKLTAFETTEPDEQQKEIMRLQKKLQRADQEIERLTRARSDCQNKCNELIREVKRLR